MERDFEQESLTFEVRGLDQLQPFTQDAHAARKRRLATVRRLTVIPEVSRHRLCGNGWCGPYGRLCGDGGRGSGIN